MAHLHSIYDTDSHFSINAISRAIKNEASTKTTLIQGDHNSERFTFEVPRYIEGHDMYESGKIAVHFINIATNRTNKSEDVYLVNDKQISPADNNVVIFSWLLSGNATIYAGTLSFIIKFTCSTGTELDYSWSTAIYKGITVGEGIDNVGAVVTQYSDLLDEWCEQVLATPFEWVEGKISEAEDRAKSHADTEIGKLLTELSAGLNLIESAVDGLGGGN